jgi:hypothetical protein
MKTYRFSNWRVPRLFVVYFAVLSSIWVCHNVKAQLVAYYYDDTGGMDPNAAGKGTFTLDLGRLAWGQNVSHSVRGGGGASTGWWTNIAVFLDRNLIDFEIVSEIGDMKLRYDTRSSAANTPLEVWNAFREYEASKGLVIKPLYTIVRG